MENNIERRKLSFWSKIVHSIKGIKHYDVVVKEKAGKAITYLLLFALLIGSIGAIRGVVETNNEISKFISAYNEKCPNFEIKDGELSVEGDQPVVLSQDSKYYFVIDTTGSTSPDVLNSYNEGILVLKDKFIEKKNALETQTFEFKSLQGTTITKGLVNNYLPLARVILPVIFIGNILRYFIGGLISALILALFALIINEIFKTQLKYGQLYSISIYALTAPMLFDVILQILNINHFSYYGFVYHLFAFAYICFGLHRLKKELDNNEGL